MPSPVRSYFYAPQSNTLPVQELSLRENAFKARMQEIAQKMGYLAKEKIEPIFQTQKKSSDDYHWYNFSMAAQGSSKEGAIYIPKLFLLNSADFPPHMRIQNSSDPRLQSDEYIICIAKEAQKLLGVGAFSIDSELIRDIRSHIHMGLDPQLKQKTLDFIFGHEIAHLYTDDSKRKMNNYSVFSLSAGQWLKSLVIAVSICLSIGVTFLTPAGVTSFAVGAALGECASGLYIFSSLQYLSYKFSRQCELEADIRAAQTLKEKAGGMNFFNISKLHIGDYESEWATHPNYSERATSLQNYRIT